MGSSLAMSYKMRYNPYQGGMKNIPLWEMNFLYHCSLPNVL